MRWLLTAGIEYVARGNCLKSWALDRGPIILNVWRATFAILVLTQVASSLPNALLKTDRVE